MAAFTSSQSGPWSSSSTWGGAGVPGAGDTVSIGAHTVTVSDTRIIGTSPNNTTTKVIDITSGSGVLVVNASLTVRGNIGGVNGSTLTLGPGGSILWDASASGGFPVYTIPNVGFWKLNINGTSGSHCTMWAPVGFTFALGQNYSQLQVAFCDFTRLATSVYTGGSGIGMSVTDCTYTECSTQELVSFQTNQDFFFNRNKFASSTNATCCKLTWNDVPTTSNPRECIGNSFDTGFTYTSYGVVGMFNYFGGGIDGTADHPWQLSEHNVVVGIRADGQIIDGNWRRDYFTSFANPNPHYIECRANVADVLFEQNIFESHDADTSDFGDCMIPVNDRFTAPFKWLVKNNLVLRNSFAPTGSGTLVTLYATGAGSDVRLQFYRNTCNVDNPASGAFARRSAFATSEAGASGADNINALKSNLVWGTSPGQGYLAERVNNFPTALDVITAANADYNWTHNLSAGNQQRFYHDQGSGANLWTAGDAVAAGVDVHQGNGDPQFYDRNRNIQSWAQDRGFGSTYADGLAALRAVPTRAADLVAYVFEGFRPGNPATRNAAHDGGCVGAANFYKASRNFAKVTTHRAALSKFGI